MVGITLSPEQITQAPPEVRRWLEQQVAAALGLYRREPAMATPERHLVGCDVENARAVFAMIQGILPVATVFFELGREPAAASPQGLRALRLDDITHRARLQSVDQLVACLKAIDTAVQRVSGTPDAVLTVLDGSGHCLVADVTARSILSLWQEIVTAHEQSHPDHLLTREVPYPTPMPFQTPYSVNVPAFTVDGHANSGFAEAGVNQPRSSAIV